MKVMKFALCEMINYEVYELISVVLVFKVIAHNGKNSRERILLSYLKRHQICLNC
jgi:hypothetical protein